MVDAGALSIIYGSVDGLTADGNQLLKQGRGGVPEVAEAGDRFGAAIATGDLNGDGYLDAAVGAPGEDLNAAQDAGSVIVLFGSADGINSVGAQLWTEASFPGLEEPDTGDGFGEHLRTGDFNSDGIDDLVIAAPGEDVGAAIDAGAVFGLYGSPSGPLATGAQLWTLDSPGIPGFAQSGDGFGSALAAANSFDLRGYADLAVGVPGKDVGAAVDAGGVSIIPGSRSGLTSANARAWTEDSPGVEGTAEPGDRFGAALSAEHFDGVDPSDLAIGTPGQDVGGVADAGEVHILFGSTWGLTATGNEAWNQDSPNVCDSAEPGDGFGQSLRSSDLSGDQISELVVGAPAEDVGTVVDAGAVTVLFGTSEGLTGDGSQCWTENSAGIQEKAEPGDRFGTSLRTGLYDGDVYSDLAISVPGESVGSVAGAGQVSLLFGTPNGPLADRNQIWSQDSAGIVDQAEAGDGFGEFIA